jgi:hypothetical protein
MHQTLTFRATAIGLLAILAVPAILFAQNARMAVTDLNQVDEDFAVQGEYSGRVIENTSGGGHSRKYGLQVVAQGGGEFRAVLYAGGLPGSGWDRQTKYSLTGRRGAEGVELSGQEVRVIVNEDGARLGSAERQFVGQLVKVRRESPTLGQAPPPNAVVLFNGEETEYLKGARITEDGLLREGVDLTKLAQDFQLHLEFRLPYMPYARGQGRANSGVYLHKRYEVQILDSFGLEGADNEAGALYREHKPMINMCLPPLSWQTYDIAFTAPRFDEEGNKVKNARVTVLLNGVAVHRDLELTSATGGGKNVGEGPNPLPINLQNHGNPVRFRNLWMVDFTRPETQSDSQTGSGIAQSGTSADGSAEARRLAAGGRPTPVPAVNPYLGYWQDNTFPGGMVPGGVVPYYVPGYYAAPLPAPVVRGW